jgi:hypothetical protein
MLNTSINHSFKNAFQSLNRPTEDYLPAPSLIRPSNSAASPKELLTPTQKWLKRFLSTQPTLSEFAGDATSFAQPIHWHARTNARCTRVSFLGRIGWSGATSKVRKQRFQPYRKPL